jgi:glycosyltransferase involved in cell wall biosynthesis
VLIPVYNNQISVSRKPGITSLSVVVLCFNQDSYIREAIESVVFQLSPIDELIVIDDYSSDSTVNAARHSISQARPSFPVRLFTKDKNRGVVNSINAIPEIASTRNIVALAGDDFYFSGAIDEIRSIVCAREGYSAVFSSCVVVNSAGAQFGSTEYYADFQPYSAEQISLRGATNISGHSLVCWNTEIITRFGPLQETVTNEDDQMILRASLLGDIQICVRTIRAYRVNTGSMSSPWTNFAIGRRRYIGAIVAPLENRLRNYLAIVRFLEMQCSASVVASDRTLVLAANYRKCIDCLRVTIGLLQCRHLAFRCRLLLSYLIRNGFSRSVYYKQNFILALSHSLYFFLKKFRYRMKYRRLGSVVAALQTP